MKVFASRQKALISIEAKAFGLKGLKVKREKTAKKKEGEGDGRAPRICKTQRQEAQDIHV